MPLLTATRIRERPQLNWFPDFNRLFFNKPSIVRWALFGALC